MNLYRFASGMALAMVGLTALPQAHASNFPSGTTVLSAASFTADNSVYSDTFTLSSSQNLTFFTTSFASGGFLPVLTLFNGTTGQPVNYSNSGLGDVSITDLLTSGSYVLDLTEYPNEAVSNLAGGFLFSYDPTATGDLCGGAVTGESFINDTTCSTTPLSNRYSVSVTPAAVAATPEPSSLALVLAPTLAAIGAIRRRRA